MEEKKTSSFKDFAKQDFSMDNLRALLPKKEKSKKKSQEVGEGDTFLPEIGNEVEEDNRSADRFASFAPVTPEVNLLPQRVIDEAGAARTSKKYMKVAIIVGAAFSILFASGAVGELAADRRADTISTEASDLSVQAGSLTPYYQYGQAVQSKRSEIFAATQGETNYPQIVRDFETLVRSVGMTTTAASFSGGEVAPAAAGIQPDNAGASAGSCVNPDPFSTETGAGCLSFTIEGPRERLLDLYEAAGNSENFLNLNVEQSLFIGGDGAEEEDGITGTIQFMDKYTTDNNYELNDPITIGQAASGEAQPPADAVPADAVPADAVPADAQGPEEVQG